MYRFGGEWYRMTPHPVLTRSPQVTEPQKMEFRYVSPKALTTGGIYKAEEVVKLRDQLMCSEERQAITNVLVRGAMGGKLDTQSISISGNLDETTLKNNCG